MHEKFFAYSCCIDCWESQELFIALPYLGNWSLSIRTCLQNSINKNLPFCKIKVIFKSTVCLCKFFCFKDKVPFNLGSNVIYKFLCCRCQHLNIRLDEHSGVSPLTRKKSKAKRTTAIKDHMLLCDHIVSLKDFKILVSSNSEFHLKIKESLLILCGKPELNRNEKSLLLYLFA